MSVTSDRIKEAMAFRDFTQADLVKKTGISKGALSSYLSGRYEPKQPRLQKIADALNINILWLLGNDVAMERVATARETGREDFIIMSALRKLDDDDQESIKKLISSSNVKHDLQLISNFYKINQNGRDTIDTMISSLLVTSPLKKSEG